LGRSRGFPQNLIHRNAFSPGICPPIDYTSGTCPINWWTKSPRWTQTVDTNRGHKAGHKAVHGTLLKRTKEDQLSQKWVAKCCCCCVGLAGWGWWPVVAIFSRASPRCTLLLLLCVLLCVPMGKNKRQRCFFCNSGHREGQKLVAVTKGVDEKTGGVWGDMHNSLPTAFLSQISSMVALSCLTHSWCLRWHTAETELEQHNQ
jgi:hypothetical protein